MSEADRLKHDLSWLAWHVMWANPLHFRLGAESFVAELIDQAVEKAHAELAGESAVVQ